MSWEEVLNSLETLKIEFDKSYKCINKHNTPTQITLEKHICILVKNYNAIRLIICNRYAQLTDDHQKYVTDYFSKLRDRLVNVFGRHKLHVYVPTSLNEELDITIDTADYKSESDSDIEEFSETDIEYKMAITALEFLNFASKIIPNLEDGNDLQRFLDAVALAKTQSTGHENTLIELIKTKLVGKFRNAISNENTIEDVITSLKSKIKTESPDVITAKLMNIKQNSKPANTFSKEIEDLTKSLETAFIQDGVSPNLADKYATQAAVKAFATNSSNDKVKLVMQSGQFSSMNDAVSKFVSTSTEYGQDRNVFFYNSNKRFNRNIHHYNGNRNFNRNNPNQNRYNGNFNNRGRGSHRGSRNSAQSYPNYYRNNNYPQNHNVRHFTEGQIPSENFNAPRAFSLGNVQQQI